MLTYGLDFHGLHSSKCDVVAVLVHHANGGGVRTAWSGWCFLHPTTQIYEVTGTKDHGSDRFPNIKVKYFLENI